MKYKQKSKVKSSTEPLDDDMEIENLKTRVLQEAPEPGAVANFSGEEIQFTSLPISRRTLRSLGESKFLKATDVQSAAIPHALAGRDILGAAKTGSGKTLSFVIPIIEKLYREHWGSEDGLGALVITPTRELALQIFEVMRKAGRHHPLSAGLLTGGKKEFMDEQLRVNKMNVLIATPGRLLQHFEQTPGFDASQLQVLVLDEADRLLDMGFSTQLDSILSYLPRSRQTLLFSATQTKSVKDLARLSLKSPEYIAIHSESPQPTPSKLQQYYMTCDLPKKLDVLYSFIKSHLQSKIIVFSSTCSQVRFVFECFRGMQPGIPLVALHGKIKQERRTIIFMDFVRRKSACLFATDVASRGLDFPTVDWVVCSCGLAQHNNDNTVLQMRDIAPVQLDAPEDSSMYIHRVGRTARYQSSGKALLLLMPCEENVVLRELENVDVRLSKLSMNPKMAMSVSQHAAALLVEQPECRILAKKAFSSYLRSLTLLPSHKAIDPKSLPLDDFSASLGLAFTPIAPELPRSSVQGRQENRDKKNVNRALDKLKKQITAIKEEKRAKRLAAQQAREAGGGRVQTGGENDAQTSGEDEDELFVGKSAEQAHDADEFEAVDSLISNNPLKKKSKVKPLRIRGDGTVKAPVSKSKVTFDEDGEEQRVDLKVERVAILYSAEEERKSLKQKRMEAEEHRRRVKAKIDEGREEDDMKDRERIREKHRAIRLRDRESRTDSSVEAPTLSSYVEEETLEDSMSEEEDQEEEEDDEISIY